MEIETLRAELEELFELEELMKLSEELLGFPPDEIGGTARTGSFVKALTEYCLERDAIEALRDAVIAKKPAARGKFASLSTETLFPTTLQEGDHFGPFTIFSALGAGPTGSVYRVQYGDRTIRLKVLRRSCSQVRRDLYRFLTYARLCRELSGPGIPKGLGVGLVDGAHYLVQEYLDGAPLGELLERRGAMHLNDAAVIIRHMLEGLDQFHTRGLIHGNLKLSNVLVRLADFGQADVELLDAGAHLLAHRAPRNGKLEVFQLASPQTAAPEVLAGEPPSPRSDLYAFGVLLYQLLTGKAPFDAERPIDCAMAHWTEIPEPPSLVAPEGWISQALDDYVLRLLDKAPEKRPEDAGAALDAFEHLMMARSQRPPASAELIEERIAALLAAPTDAALALMLEAVADEGGNATRVAETFLQAMSLFEHEPGEENARSNLAFRAGRLFRQAGETERAEQVYAQLVEFDPTNQVAVTALEDLRRQLGKFDELIESWLAQANSDEEAADRAEAMAKIGTLYENELKDPSQAVVAFTQAFCENPDHDEYARAVERLAKGDTNTWNEVLQSCSEAAENRQGDETAQLLSRMGRWYADKLSRFDLALQCYQTLLSQDAANETAIAGVTHIYRRAQQWPELAQALLQNAAAAATRSQARDLRCEAAVIYQTRLNDAAMARRLYEEVLEDDPSHKQASDALSELLQASGDFTGYVRLLRQRAEATRGAEHAALLCRIGEAQEDRLNEPEQALATYQAVLEEDPANAAALRGLDRLYSKLGRYSDLLNNLQEQVRVAATPRQKLGLYERIAAIHEEEFLDPDLAVFTYQQALAVDGRSNTVLTALERLYTAARRWNDACDTYQRHAETLEDPARRAQLLLERARILDRELESEDAAIDAYEAVLREQPGHPDALAALAKLKASVGDSDEALRAIETLAENSQDPTVKAENYVRAADLLEARSDWSAAIDRYQLALQSIPDHLAASEGLRRVHLARGDIETVAELLMQAIEGATLDSNRAKLSTELARLAFEQMKDWGLAETAANAALEADRTAADALQVLAEVQLAQGRPTEAAELFERLMSQLDRLEPERATHAVLQYIDALAQTGSTERALRYLETAKQLAPDDLDALLRVADVAFEHAEPKMARDLYTDILDRFEEQLTPRDRFLVVYRRAESTRRAGEVALAIMLLQDAADLDPTSPVPLRSLADAYEQTEQWEMAWETKNQALELLEGEERVQSLLELGELAHHKLADHARAVRCFVAALDEQPGDRKLLTRLMQLYSEDKDWGNLVEVVIKLADFQQDPSQKAKYLMTAAMVNARELGELDAALDYFAQVLELDPSQEKAFQESLAIYRDRADYTSAERLLKKKMKAASAAKDTENLLIAFDGLGELYREIGRVDDAVDAFEAAQTLDPDNRDRLESLSELYATHSAKFFEKARTLQEKQLRVDPYRADAYKALRRLYTETKNADGAWCLCQALYVLNLAGPDEERFFARMRSEDPAYAQEVLGDEEWGLLAHEELDPYLTSIFALIEPAVIQSRGQSLEQIGYHPYQAVDLSAHQYPIGQTLFYAAGVMNQEPPVSFENHNDPGGLAFLPSNPPALSMGVGLLQGQISPQALAFLAGRHLCYYRPGFFLRQLITTGTLLKSWMFAAIKLMSPQFPVAADLEGSVTEAVEILRHGLTQPAKDELARVVSKLLQSTTALDLKRWLNSVDATADRVGFLLSHDLETAIEVIRSGNEDAANVQRRLKELVLFAISQPYLTLREHLGIHLSV